MEIRAAREKLAAARCVLEASRERRKRGVRVKTLAHKTTVAILTMKP